MRNLAKVVCVLFCSGGVTLTFRGNHLDVVVNPELILTIDGNYTHGVSDSCQYCETCYAIGTLFSADLHTKEPYHPQVSGPKTTHLIILSH